MSQFKEIIDKLKNAGFSVSDFAYDKIPCNVANYPEAIKAKEYKELFRKENTVDGQWLPGKYEEYNQLPNAWNIAQKLFLLENNIPSWTEVDSYGGEGQGDTWYSIKYFQEYDLYIRVDGWYQSHYGVEFYDGWDSCKEVKPKKKTITVYE